MSLSLIVIIGCNSSSGSSDSKDSSNKTLTGNVANVDGLYYGTNAPQKITTNGNYEYKKGETISFYIGDFKIGSVKGQEQDVFLNDILKGNDSELNKKALVLLALLNNNDFGNSDYIFLDSEIQEKLKNGNLSSLVERVNSSGGDLNKIAENLKGLLEEEIENIPVCNCDFQTKDNIPVIIKDIIEEKEEDKNEPVEEKEEDKNEPVEEEEENKNEPVEEDKDQPVINLGKYKYDFLKFFHKDGYRLKSYTVTEEEKEYTKKFTYIEDCVKETLTSFSEKTDVIRELYINFEEKPSYVVSEAFNFDGNNIFYQNKFNYNKEDLRIVTLIGKKEGGFYTPSSQLFLYIINSTNIEVFYDNSYLATDSGYNPVNSYFAKTIDYDDNKILSAEITLPLDLKINSASITTVNLEYKYSDSGKITEINNNKGKYTLTYDSSNPGNIKTIEIKGIANKDITIAFEWEKGVGGIENPFFYGIRFIDEINPLLLF
ncbi:MAG: hypothetical protein RBR53_07890 [Desulforegulaceae bacterium]|nr:hypothetical protein [Desulforegulaceae bacterium]